MVGVLPRVTSNKFHFRLGHSNWVILTQLRPGEQRQRWIRETQGGLPEAGEGERFPSARCLRQKAGRGREGGVVRGGGERGEYWSWRRIGADRASAASAEERLRCNPHSPHKRFCDSICLSKCCQMNLICFLIFWAFFTILF